MEYGFAAEYGGKSFLNEYIRFKNKKIIVLDKLNEINPILNEFKKDLKLDL